MRDSYDTIIKRLKECLSLRGEINRLYVAVVQLQINSTQPRKLLLIRGDETVSMHCTFAKYLSTGVVYFSAAVNREIIDAERFLHSTHRMK